MTHLRADDGTLYEVVEGNLMVVWNDGLQTTDSDTAQCLIVRRAPEGGEEWKREAERRLLGQLMLDADRERVARIAQEDYRERVPNEYGRLIEPRPWAEIEKGAT